MDKRSALRNLEFDYLADYLCFAGQSREYVSDCLDDAFHADPTPLRRPFHVLAQVQLEYAAYEDAAAMLRSLLMFRGDPSVSIIESLEAYRPGDAVIGKVLADHSAESADQLFDKLGFQEACPADWGIWFPQLDLPKALRLGCRFFADDCAASHKALGIAAYNKSKHGPLAVQSGKVLSTQLQPEPSLFFANKWPEKYGAMPVVVYGFPATDEKVAERSRVIHFIQRTLRLFVATVIGRSHAQQAQAHWGSVEVMWRSTHLRDILEFVAEITAKK